MAFPAWYLAVAAAGFLLWGSRAALAIALVMPVTGLAAIAWRDRQATVREDVRVFLRARRRSQARDRLREQRVQLVAEFDALTGAWREDMERRRATREP